MVSLAVLASLFVVLFRSSTPCAVDHLTLLPNKIYTGHICMRLLNSLRIFGVGLFWIHTSVVPAEPATAALLRSIYDGYFLSKTSEDQSVSELIRPYPIALPFMKFPLATLQLLLEQAGTEAMDIPANFMFILGSSSKFSA